MEAHSANILRKSGRGASREGFSMFGPRGIPCGGYMFGPVASPGRSPCSGVEPLFRRARHRVGADRWERRGSAWTLCSGGAGRIFVRVAAVSGRAGRIPRTQGLPSSRAAPSGRGPDAPFSDSFCPFLQRPAAPEPTPFANPRFRRSGKAKKLFFYFYFIIKDVSLCSQNNT